MGTVEQSGEGIGGREKGTVVAGRYEVLRQISQGPIYGIYECRHRYSGRHVALKILQPELEDNFIYKQALMHEAEALGSVENPGIVNILDAGMGDVGDVYIAMELLEGRGLDGLLASRGKLPPRQVIQLGLQICESLTHLHEKGIVHRNLCPENLVVCRDYLGNECVKLIGFGSSLVPGASRPDNVPDSGYVAPELLENADDQTGLSDQFSAAVVLHECLLGSLPDRVGDQVYPGDLPPAAADALARAWAHPARDRHSDCLAFGRALAKAYPKSTQAKSLLGLPGVASASLYRVAPRAMESMAATAHEAATTPPPPSRPAGKELRKYQRAPYVTPVRLNLQSGRIDGRTEDLSEGGLLVMTNQGVPSKQRGNVRFALPLLGTMITTPVEVRWVKEGGRQTLLGLRFEELEGPAREAISKYVELMCREVEAP